MSSARDRAENRDVIETGLELGSVSCGCGVALGLAILGTCAGVGTSGTESSGLKVAAIIAVIAAVVIVALVYLLTRNSAKLKAARADIDELTRKQSQGESADPGDAGPSPGAS